ncbi:tRNA pseudouridine(38/39) synthase isoform X2 [Diabrotica undecimpunctata]|uniref:tRNA pseudouridine(38/39) synthase isoform X2 n=1 Tax=Diabrotica undecimpunctata TaxID=50387 RepID=UPI003B6321CF
MDPKVKKKQNKTDVIENLEDYSKEELIQKIKTLSAHNVQLKNLLSKGTASEEKPVKSSKSFDFSRYQFQHIALHFLYLGWDYKGFVVQEDTTNTVEYHLFQALQKTKLIPDRASSNYHRCGRTDKGKMRLATEKLIGAHDFRNFCKMDVGNGVIEFIRKIDEINIESISQNEGDYDMYVIIIKGKAFLWHQIRCIMGVLFLIGQENEVPEVIDELLNVTKNPRKPAYSMASEIPLNLYYCQYDDLNWNYDQEALTQVIEKLNKQWSFQAVKSELIKGMVTSLVSLKRKNEEGDSTYKCLSENLIQGIRCKKYQPLLERQSCHSLEHKIEHFTKRRKLKVENKE